MPVLSPITIAGFRGSQGQSQKSASCGISFSNTDTPTGKSCNGITISAAWQAIDFNATQSSFKMTGVRSLQFALDCGGSRIASHGGLVIYVPTSGQVIFLSSTDLTANDAGTMQTLISGIIPVIDAGSNPIWIGKLPGSDGSIEGAVSLTFFDFDLPAYVTKSY